MYSQMSSMFIANMNIHPELFFLEIISFGSNEQKMSVDSNLLVLNSLRFVEHEKNAFKASILQ
jgi:hypothetical protein